MRELLSAASEVECVLASPDLADELTGPLQQRWGSLRRVVDVVHLLENPQHLAEREHEHPSPSEPVRQLSPDEVTTFPALHQDLWPPALDLVVEAARKGCVFGCVVDGRIVAQASALARTARHADIAVHVAEPFRRRGLATAAARLVVEAVQQMGLAPVWGAGAHNLPSLEVARRLRFVEHLRMVYLVREHVEET